MSGTTCSYHSLATTGLSCSRMQGQERRPTSKSGEVSNGRIGKDMERETVLVLDFGGQYNQLIARCVRECNVYAEVHPYTMSLDEIKKINPKKEIKPDTFQVREGQCLVIPELFRIDYIEGNKNSFTFFVSNELEIDKRNTDKCEELTNLTKRTINVGYHQDIVINGLGFIKIVEKAVVDIYVENNVEVFVRDSLI